MHFVSEISTSFISLPNRFSAKQHLPDSPEGSAPQGKMLRDKVSCRIDIKALPCFPPFHHPHNSSLTNATMTLSKTLKKILAVILCCNQEDVDQGYTPSSVAYTKPRLSAVKSRSRASATSYHTAKSHLTPEASAASRHSAISKGSSASGSSIYYTASEGSDTDWRDFTKRVGSSISRQSSGGRSGEQYSLGKFTPRSSAALSHVSSTSSAMSDQNYWADRARRSSGIFGDSPEKKANFNLVEMNFWNDDKRNGWKTARSSASAHSAPRLMIPRGRSQRSSMASVRSGAPVLSAWNSDSPMFL
jgi:hypothetical protein